MPDFFLNARGAVMAAGLTLLLAGSGAAPARAETDAPVDATEQAAPGVEDEWSLIRKVKLDRRLGTTAFGYVLDRPALISLSRLLGPAGAEYFLDKGRIDPDLARANGPTAWLNHEIHRFLAISARRAPEPANGRAAR